MKIDRAVAREIVLAIGAALTRLSKFANVALGNAAGVISPEEPSRIIAKKVHTLRELEMDICTLHSKIVGQLCNK